MSRALLEDAAHRAISYLESLGTRPVAPTPAAVAALVAFERPLPAGPSDPAATLAELDAIGSPATMAFGDAARTRRVIADIQADGTLWCGPTVWQGHTAARISVSSWATTDDDVTKSIAAIVRIAAT